LFEIQALTVNTSFGYPRRTTTGYNANRLQVLLAIIEKRANVSVGNHDVYLSIAGGFKITEYGADLAACLSVISSLKNKPIKPNTAVFGECGLGGEVRRVPHIEKRIKEAKKLGYTNIISSENAKTLADAVKLAF
jgi:DNA repair protein RadA/Sms